MASGSQNMTTYNARTVTGSNSAASPAGALLLSGAGRADNATGDTWIFLDSAGGTSTPWGIKHDQANNKIQIFGAGTNSVWTRMNTGDTYILGKVGIGYDPETSENLYKLYVNGNTYFNGNTIHNGMLDLKNDLNLYTSSADSPDIVWWYADKGQEQARIWVGSGGTSTFAPYYRCYNSSGTQLYLGHLVLGNGTGASGTWGISISGNAATATRINGNLVAATSDVNRNIWVSSSGNADGIPNYISGFYMNPSTKIFNVPASTRISPSAGALYLGNSGNQGWVYIQDMCSQDGQKWKIHQSGAAEFNGTVTAPTFSGNATTSTSIAVTAAAENDCIPGTDRFQAFRCTSSSTGGGDGYIWAQRWSSGNYVTQIYTEVDPSYLMCYRFKKNADSTWGAWKRIPMGDGTGASGTWGINITGSAGSVAWGNVTGKPSTFAPSSHSHSYLPLSGGVMTGAIQFNSKGSNSIYNGPNDNTYGVGGALNNLVISSWWGVSFTTSCGGQTYSNKNAVSIDCRSGFLYAAAVHNAVWNDLAEQRKSYVYEPGYAIAPSGHRTSKRLESGACIISDTYGMCMGEIEGADNLAPVGLVGRVLAYPLHDKSYYEVGDAVCAAEGGKIDKMTREEIKEYPDRIIGIVNEIPDYDIWEPSREGGGREPIHTNGRIWIDVR